MSVFFKLIISFSYLFIFSNFSFADNKQFDGKVIISISSKKDVIKGKRSMCEVKFSILNSSFGTINDLRIAVNAENDRGRKLKNWGVPEVTNKTKWNPIPIPKGKMLENVKGATFEEECQYMGKIELAFSKIKEDSCNIRMRPEGTKWRDIFVLVNEGEDAGVKLAKQASNTGPKFLDVGYVTINGKKVSFVDYAAEDPYDLRGKNIVIVGYMNSLYEWPRHRVWGYRFDIKMFSGVGGQSYARGGDPYLTVLIAPFKSKNYGSDLAGSLANLRKEAFKTLSSARMGKALIEVKGKANTFSNTGDLYIQAENIRIIAKE